MVVPWNYVWLLVEFGVNLLLKIQILHGIRSNFCLKKIRRNIGSNKTNSDVEGFCLEKLPSAKMTTVKGLLKGLRYISQIFDNEKEQEMQIGNPTDVKHVAHIGCDGPSSNTPTWMNEFQGNSNGEVKDTPSKSSIEGSPLRDITEIQKPPGSLTRRNSTKTKQSRRHHASSALVGSPTRDSLGANKPRRYKNSGSLDSPTQESSNRARRLQNSILGSEPPSQNMPGVKKESHRRKSKGSLGGGSTMSPK